MTFSMTVATLWKLLEMQRMQDRLYFFIAAQIACCTADAI